MWALHALYCHCCSYHGDKAESELCPLHFILIYPEPSFPAVCFLHGMHSPAGESDNPALLELVLLPFWWVQKIPWSLISPAEEFAVGGSPLFLRCQHLGASVCSHLMIPASFQALHPQKEWNNSLSALPTTANLQWYRSALWDWDGSAKQKGVVCCWLYFFSTCSRMKFNFYVRCLFFKVNLNTSFPPQFL